MLKTVASVSLALLACVLSVTTGYAQTSCPTDAQITTALAKGEALARQYEQTYEPQLLALEDTFKGWIAIGCDTDPSTAGCPTQGQLQSAVKQAEALEQRYLQRFEPQIEEILALNVTDCTNVSLDLQLLRNELTFIATIASSIIKTNAETIAEFEAWIKGGLRS